MTNTINIKQRAKIATQISGLMAKTESRGATEAEALAAMRKIGELLAKYNLTMDEVSLRGTVCETLVIHTGRGASDSMQWVISALSLYTDTKYWKGRARSNGKKVLTYCFYGHKSDLEIVEYFYHLINNTMETETNIFKNTRAYHMADQFQGGRRRASTSFQRGFIDRIIERLEEMKPVAPQETTGTSLVVLKKQIVNAEFSKTAVASRLKHTTVNLTGNNNNSYVAGHNAGGRANLNTSISGS